MNPHSFLAFSSKEILKLSDQEIKSDFREVQRHRDSADSDDESIRSEDILSSSYPVKPRYPPPPARQYYGSTTGKARRDAQQAMEQNRPPSSDDIILFIKDLAKVRPDLCAAEEERERLEFQHYTYQATIEKAKSVHATRMVESHNYIRLMQALFTRSLNLHATYSRQNTTLFRVFDALNKKKDAEIIVESELTKLVQQRKEAKKENNSHNNKEKEGVCKENGAGVSTSTAAQQHDSVKFLKVHLATSDRDVLLYIDQTVNTSMGNGSISEIMPIARKVVIRLPFGLMYVHLARAVCWLGDSGWLDCGETAGEIERQLEQDLRCTHTLPEYMAKLIHSVVAVEEEEEEEEENDKKKGKNSKKRTPRGGDSDDCGSSNGEDEDDEDGDEEEEEEDAGASVRAETKGGPTTANETASAKSLAAAAAAVAVASLGKHATVYPLVDSGSNSAIAVNRARTDLRHLIDEGYSVTGRRLAGETVWPLALIPPEHLVSYLFEISNENAAVELAAQTASAAAAAAAAAASPLRGYAAGSKIAVDLTSLQDTRNTLALQKGYSRNSWGGSIDVLQKNLLNLEEQALQLESQIQRQATLIENKRKNSLKLSADVAAIRLNAFTRRIAHRNFLAGYGIHASTFPPFNQGLPVVPITSVAAANAAVAAAALVAKSANSGAAGTATDDGNSVASEPTLGEKEKASGSSSSSGSGGNGNGRSSNSSGSTSNGGRSSLRGSGASSGNLVGLVHGDAEKGIAMNGSSRSSSRHQQQQQQQQQPSLPQKRSGGGDTTAESASSDPAPKRPRRTAR